MCGVFRLETKQQKINELQEKLAISEKQLAFILCLWRSFYEESN